MCDAKVSHAKTREEKTRRGKISHLVTYVLGGHRLDVIVGHDRSAVLQVKFPGGMKGDRRGNKGIRWL